nr:MAG TPA: hypothetical protein [Caudoviricetes sp.]
MLTYKDIVRDIFKSCDIEVPEDKINIARKVLVDDLRAVSVEQFMFVEDGSIDLTTIRDLKKRNPEIKVIVYRQGSLCPVIKEV